MITITWDVILEATSYLVRSATDPLAEFNTDDSGVFTDASWTTPAAETRKFYRVLAIRE
jgi:hypothetical protein